MADTILAIDCGSATTTALLIEPTDGRYSLIAASQAFSSWDTDITLGVISAIQQLEKQTERKLLTPDNLPLIPRDVEQQGADAFVVVSSAGKPLSVVLAGLTQNITLTSARRAASTSYIHINGELSLDDKQNAGQEKIISQIQTIQNGQPEAILFVGGTDGGTERPVIELANIISMATQLLQTPKKPTVIFAGNVETRTQVAGILRPVVPFKAVSNLRPVLDSENLTEAKTELESLYLRQKIFRLPGFDKLRSWSQFPIMPTGKSYEKVIAYISQRNNLNVLGANIGSRSTIITASTQEQHNSTVRTDAGVGHSLSSLLEIVPLEKFQRWLPFEISPAELRNQLLNKSLQPATVPTTYKELMIEYATAREALLLTAGQERNGWPIQKSTGRRDIHWNLIIGAGRTLTEAPNFAYAALVMLDALEPWGVTSLFLDVKGLVNLLGSIAAMRPMAAVELATIEQNKHSAFLNLGTVIAPVGRGQQNKPALIVKMSYDGYTTDMEIPNGVIKRIDLPTGKKATLEISPSRHLDIGLGQLGRSAVAEVEGGILGIIIDTRGRPVRLPRDETERIEKLKQWLMELGVKYEDS